MEFRNVHGDWLEKTLTYQQVQDQLALDALESEDIEATVADMVPATENGCFVMKHIPTGRCFIPSGHCGKQIAVKAAIGTWSFANLRNSDTTQRDSIDADTLCQMISNGWRRLNQTKMYLWRVRKDGTLRAMLTARYALVSHTWLLDTIAQIIPHGRLSHWHHTQDNISGHVLIPDLVRQEPHDNGVLLKINNSETGENRIITQPILFKSITNEGHILETTPLITFSKVHRGSIQLDELFKLIKENLTTQIPMVPVTDLLNV